MNTPVPDKMTVKVSLKTGDNITTDHIMPAGAKILPFRSNIPYMSQFCFSALDKEFPERAKAYKASVIIGGVNYGQGSS
ncbi:MAG: aconitate hydratase, partial [Christensenellaceae bacterium]